jgi:GTP cyclohydrolase II
MVELKEAGVFKILAPKGVGGYGMGLETYVEVVRRLAQGCPSTAWNCGPPDRARLDARTLAPGGPG